MDARAPPLQATVVKPEQVTVFDALRRSLGSHAVDTSEETLVRYGRNLLPAGDRRPAGVVFPASTAEVQAIVRIANAHRAPLYSFSTGENRGNGLRSPIQPGQIIVDVGARMHRILEIDETLCFAAIEPGVTYQQMYDVTSELCTLRKGGLRPCFMRLAR